MHKNNNIVNKWLELITRSWWREWRSVGWKSGSVLSSFNIQLHLIKLLFYDKTEKRRDPRNWLIGNFGLYLCCCCWLVLIKMYSPPPSVRQSSVSADNLALLLFLTSQHPPLNFMSPALVGCIWNNINQLFILFNNTVMEYCLIKHME